MRVLTFLLGHTNTVHNLMFFFANSIWKVMQKMDTDAKNLHKTSSTDKQILWNFVALQRCEECHRYRQPWWSITARYRQPWWSITARYRQPRWSITDTGSHGGVLLPQAAMVEYYRHRQPWWSVTGTDSHGGVLLSLAGVLEGYWNWQPW